MQRLVPNRTQLIGLTASLVLFSCGADEPRYEQINKLRSIGAEQTPINATYGSTVTVRFFLAGPSGLNLKASNFKDTAAKYGLPVDITFSTASPVEEKHAALSVYTLSGTLTIPQESLLNKFIVGTAPARVRFGASFAASSEDETIIGDILVYPKESTELSWKAPSLSIVEPLGDTTSTNSKVKTVINVSHSEPHKYSWFVSSGQLLNHRAVSTEWKEQTTGAQTIIATARGTKSGAFSIAVKDVTVN
jgi:hypothetical protein